MNAHIDEGAAAMPLREEPMARHTSWRVGGPAELYFEPATVEALQSFLRSLPSDMPLNWIGLGSNLLVRDGGLRGAVVSTLGLPRAVSRVEGDRVRADAAVPCAVLARRCAGWQLGPAAFFAGIPGTVGGALAMNAGAFGGETWERVEQVETIDRGGRLHARARADYRIGYRSVSGPAEEWFLAATFRFEAGRGAEQAAIRDVRARRSASQPLGQRSCGSVFRNPAGEFAGRLIERAGMKGSAVGGARVSDKHANFIINTGSATAEDIETLIKRIRDAVRDDSGIDLELEVRVIGERGAK